jgi:hypothetical protein
MFEKFDRNLRGIFKEGKKYSNEVGIHGMHPELLR